jgi:3-oxoacyl-[acyl-carrier protein] reductase
MTDEQWQLGFETTLMNVVRMVRHVTPGMKERHWGRIIHVTSVVAKQPDEILPISTTLRSGLRALTRMQSTELAPHGITVNSVLPGHTLTDRQTHLAEVRAAKSGRTPAEELEIQGGKVPVGRLGRPDEIAAAAAFLCSERASYISGVNLLVDGGISTVID